MSKYSIDITSHVPEIKAELESRIPVIMEAVALQAEGNAVDEITMLGAVDTGRLRGSITHTTDDEYAYIGTNVEYAPYVELGASRMAARPFLRNAVTKRVDDYD